MNKGFEVAGLSRRLRLAETTSVELADNCLQTIAADNPDLNAFVQVLKTAAQGSAIASDLRRRDGNSRSPLDGIPIAIKDNIAVQRAVWSNGVGALREHRAEQNAHVVQMLEDAGAVMLGKLNMDEAALGADCNNPHFGACYNPLVAGDTPGGSSGGCAAAVAAGMCAAALGSDTLGSVRIPAAYCGITGFLPSAGLLSRTGVYRLSESLDRLGVLALTVADVAMVFTAMCGYDQMDPQSIPGAGDFSVLVDALENPMPGRLRIGRINSDAGIDGDDADCIRTALRRAQQLLTDHGHSVSAPIDAPTDFTGLRREALLVIEAEGYQACLPWLDRDGVSESLRGFLQYGANQPAARIESARACLRNARLLWCDLLNDFDLLLLPVAPQCSFVQGHGAPVNQADFTAPASIAGLPAISLPAGLAKSTRPLAVQLVAPAFADARLLCVSAQLQGAFTS